MAHKRIISVIGLGYVGLTIAVALSKIGKVIGFDINETRIKELKEGRDHNKEVNDEDLLSSFLYFTSDPSDLKEADFHIIAVLTSLDKNKLPDLKMLLVASETLGKQLKTGDIVVYESTAYPGATEEKCIPALEKYSHLSCGKDFTVGYSPERINPSDKKHVFSNIIKIISGSDQKTVEIISDVYQAVVTAGIYRVSSIRVAEVCKVIENTQRDVNIALMNDIAIMLHQLGIDTAEVFAAMKTKWNSLPFQPGLVGGHCIGINSHYLMYKSEQAGYHSEIISAARRTNEFISHFIVNETIKCLINRDIAIKNAKIAVLGLTYKENCPDIRDTKVIDIIRDLQIYGIQVLINDSVADSNQAEMEYGITLQSLNNLRDLDAIIITVAHDTYRQLSKNDFLKMLNKNGIIIDVKGILDLEAFKDTNIKIWRL